MKIFISVPARLPVCSPKSSFTSLCLGFLICKTGISTVGTCSADVGLHELIHVMDPGQRLAKRKRSVITSYCCITHQPKPASRGSDRGHGLPELTQQEGGRRDLNPGPNVSTARALSSVPPGCGASLEAWPAWPLGAGLGSWGEGPGKGVGVGEGRRGCWGDRPGTGSLPHSPSLPPPAAAPTPHHGTLTEFYASLKCTHRL